MALIRTFRWLRFFFLLLFFGPDVPPLAGAPESDPALSSPLRLIFRSRGDYLGSVDLGEANFKRLPIDGTVVHFAVAPTMDRMLFVLREDRPANDGTSDTITRFKLGTCDLDGNNQRIVTDKLGDPNIYYSTVESLKESIFENCGGPTYPHWAPDGERILFATWRGPEGQFTFNVANATDQSITPLITIPGPTRVTNVIYQVSDVDFTPSPYATMRAHPMAYLATSGHYPAQAFNAGKHRTYAMFWYGGNVRWHPDGRSITWSSETGTNRVHIWVRDLNGFDQEDPQTLNDAFRMYYAPQFLWAPNGRWIATINPFSMGRDGIGHQLYIGDRQGGGPWELFRDQAHPRTSVLRLLTWSADSTKLAVYISSDEAPHTIYLFNLNAWQSPPTLISNVRVPGQLNEVEHPQLSAFSSDGTSYFYIRHAVQGREVTHSMVESILVPTNAPAAGTPGTPPAPELVFTHTDSIRAMQIITPKPPDVDVPELPLVIPVAELEGSLKSRLVVLKKGIEEELKKAKDLEDQRKTVNADEFDSVALLKKWFAGNKEILTAERRAREMAEEFFQVLAMAYDELSASERQRVEEGLPARAFALRRYRTVKRRIVRENAGMGTMSSAKRLDEYYSALGRATWSALEIDALARMWNAVNAARVILHGGYDVYALTEPTPDARLVASINLARYEQFKALIDQGISCLLASESRYEATIDARKDRLFGMKEWWDTTKKIAEDPLMERKEKGLKTQLFSLGLGVFDIMTGLGADAFKETINWGANAEFQTRAGKLEAKSMENWEKTQRKVLLLRLLRERPLAELIPLAEQAAQGVPVHTLPLVPGKIDAQDINYLMQDRVFDDATEGGLLRLFSVLVDPFHRRCQMELMIARINIWLIHHDMQAAYRAEQGLDPETGDLSWGSILSPTAWADLVSQNLAHWDHYTTRKDQLKVKEGQLEACDRLLGPLTESNFEFDRLPPAPLQEHTQLLALSAPYIRFCMRVRQEQAAWTRHQWRQALKPDLTPELLSELRHREELLQFALGVAQSFEIRRLLERQYHDLVYAWDLGGALSLARRLTNDVVFANRVKWIEEAICIDRVKESGVQLYRNVGDIGIIGAVSAGFARIGAVSFGTEGVVLHVEKALLTTDSFAVYVYKAFNPLARGTGEVIEEALTEVVTDIGVSYTSEKYSDLIEKLAEVALETAGHRIKMFKASIVEHINAARAANPTPLSRQLEQFVRESELVKNLETQIQLWERRLRTPDPQVQESIARQNQEADRANEGLMVLDFILRQHHAVKESLAELNTDLALAREHYARLYRQARRRAGLPTLAMYEDAWARDRDDFFHPEQGLDIQKIRSDARLLGKTIRDADKPRLENLLAAIDQERQARFAAAMTDLLKNVGGQVKGVILNGTSPQNPEYKGIFSDRDFTLVVAPGANMEALRQAANRAFEAHRIVLNEPGKPASADVEVMIQSFLPSDIERIDSPERFLQYAVDLGADADTRHLSVGGTLWVSLYNHLNGGTMRLNGGEAVIDLNPDPSLLPKPSLHPMFAHGLLLDMARFDKLQDPSTIDNVSDLAEMMETRSKSVLRAVDALVWATAPELMRSRTREAAQRQGYHALIVADARELVRRGRLTPAQFQLIQVLADIKQGSGIYLALGLDPGVGEGNRPRLDQLWREANALMRISFAETRGVYLEWMTRLAQAGPAKGQDYRPLLYTIAFRNWNAARNIDPVRLGYLSGWDGQQPHQTMKRIDQLTMDDPELPPPPVAEAGGLRPPIDPPSRPPDLVAGDPGDNEPRDIRPDRMPRGGEEPPPTPPQESTAVHPLEPFTSDELSNIGLLNHQSNEDYCGPDGHAIAIVKTATDSDPYVCVNELVAFLFGRLFGANVPNVHVIKRPGEPDICIMRLVPGDNLNYLIKGQNPKGNVVRIPRGLSLEQMLAHPEFKKNFLIDQLLGALIGDNDRRDMNYVVSPDGQLFPIDHANARPVEFDLDPAALKKRIIDLLSGDRRVRRLQEQMNITFEEIAPLWADLNARLTPEALQQLASHYPPEIRPQVVATWQARIDLIADVIRTLWPEQFVNIDADTQNALALFREGKLGQSVKGRVLAGKSMAEIEYEMVGDDGWQEIPGSSLLRSPDGKWTKKMEVRTEHYETKEPIPPWRLIFYEHADGGVIRLKPDGMTDAAPDKPHMLLPHGCCYVKKLKDKKGADGESDSSFNNEAFKVYGDHPLPKWDKEMTFPEGVEARTPPAEEYIGKTWRDLTHQPLKPDRKKDGASVRRRGMRSGFHTFQSCRGRKGWNARWAHVRGFADGSCAAHGANSVDAKVFVARERIQFDGLTPRSRFM